MSNTTLVNTYLYINLSHVGVCSERFVVFQVLLIDHTDSVVGSGVVLDQHVILTTAQHFQR